MSLLGATPTSGGVCTYVRCLGHCRLVLLDPSFSESDPQQTCAPVRISRRPPTFANIRNDFESYGVL